MTSRRGCSATTVSLGLASGSVVAVSLDGDRLDLPVSRRISYWLPGVHGAFQWAVGPLGAGIDQDFDVRAQRDTSLASVEIGAWGVGVKTQRLSRATSDAVGRSVHFGTIEEDGGVTAASLFFPPRGAGPLQGCSPHLRHRVRAPVLLAMPHR